MVAKAKTKPDFNPFLAAKSKPVDKTEAKKNGHKEINVPGLADYIAAAQVETRAKAFKEVLKPAEFMTQYFVAESARTHRVPENFDGVDGTAKGSCQLRRKGANQPLKSEEVQILAEHDIEVGHVEDFKVNSEYLTNEEYMKAAGDALGALVKAGRLPEDFIQYEKKDIVTEETLAAVCALTNDRNLTAESKINMLLPLVAVLAIRPAKGGDSDKDFAKAVTKLLENITKHSKEEVNIV